MINKRCSHGVAKHAQNSGELLVKKLKSGSIACLVHKGRMSLQWGGCVLVITTIVIIILTVLLHTVTSVCTKALLYSWCGK